MKIPEHKSLIPFPIIVIGTLVLLSLIIAMSSVIVINLHSIEDDNQKIAHDFTTPEGAILVCEDAYREKDIEKVVSCHNFKYEAKMLLEDVFKDDKNLKVTPDLISETAKVLELGFRKNLKKNGIPDLSNSKQTFVNTRYKDENTAIVTERHEYPGGDITEEEITVLKTPTGWKIFAAQEAKLPTPD